MEQSSYFVDEYKQFAVPDISTWQNLSVNELMDVRSLLASRQEYYIRNRQIYYTMQERIDYITQLISNKKSN